MFSTAFFTAAAENFVPVSQALPTAQSTTETLNVTKQIPETIPEKNAGALTRIKKNGLKYGIFKFLLAMTGVTVSALAIFIGLKLYQKFILNKGVMPSKTAGSSEFETPKDFKEALNLFLDKTDL